VLVSSANRYVVAGLMTKRSKSMLTETGCVYWLVLESLKI
jgi:hypothetical protein